MCIVGLDIGYGFTKVVTDRMRYTFPSLVGPAITIKYHNDLISNGHGLEVGFDEQRWFIGDLARLQSPFTLSPLARERDAQIIRALLLAALYRVEVASEAQHVHLVTGLPVSWYGDRESLVQMMRGPHLHTLNGEPRTLNVADVLVVPQPFGSFFRMLLTGQGRLPQESVPMTRQRIGVIDIGTHTTDYALADALRYVEPKSGSIQVAMAKAIELAQRAISEAVREVDFQETAEALRTGEVLVRGQPVDVSALVEQATEHVGRQIVGEALTLWGGGDDLANVIVTGGGAEVFIDAIRAVYTHAHVMPDAQIANADGFYRYGLRKFGAEALRI